MSVAGNMTPTDEQTRKAISVVRAYLAAELITEGCRSDPCFGCVGCLSVELDHRLHALYYFIGDE